MITIQSTVCFVVEPIKQCIHHNWLLCAESCARLCAIAMLSYVRKLCKKIETLTYFICQARPALQTYIQLCGFDREPTLTCRWLVHRIYCKSYFQFLYKPNFSVCSKLMPHVTWNHGYINNVLSTKSIAPSQLVVLLYHPIQRRYNVQSFFKGCWPSSPGILQIFYQWALKWYVYTNVSESIFRLREVNLHISFFGMKCQ